jgi:hypothetical protein
MIERSTYPHPPVLRRSRQPDAQSSAQKYQPDVQKMTTEALPRQKRESWILAHSVPLGVGMLIMLVLYLVGVNIVLPWVVVQVDHWNTGEARLSQFDIDVGHHGTSHFLAQYLHKQAVVVEIPQDHPEQTKVYAIPIIVVGDNTQRIVTLKPLYVSRHSRPGNPDLVVQVEGFTVSPVLYNTGDGFTMEAG